MKVNFINKEKIKKIVGCALVGSLLAAPVVGVAQDYTVEPGDTLKKISQQFYGTNKYYDEIAFLNGIGDPSMIKAGDVIYLPNDYRELEFCGQDDKWVDNNILYYTFGPNDTLWGLAERFYGDGTYWKSLASFNGITNPKNVQDGRVVMIPPFSYLNMDALNWTFDNSTNQNGNTSTTTERSIVFGPKDTLWAIASKYYGSGNYWDELAEYNDIDDPRTVINGTRIYLPSKKTLNEIHNNNQKKDLYTISKEQYGSSRYAGVIATLNNTTISSSFNPKELYLPGLDDIISFYESDTFIYETDGYYVVQKGDTFEDIALLVYEDISYADYIRDNNEVDKLTEGMTIYIPAKEVYTK